LFVNEKYVGEEDLEVIGKCLPLEFCSCPGCMDRPLGRYDLSSVQIAKVKNTDFRINIGIQKDPYNIKNKYILTFWQGCPNNGGHITDFENVFEKLSDEHKTSVVFNLKTFR
jgi:hypothetical protein